MGETSGSVRPFIYDGGLHYTQEKRTSKLLLEFSVKRKGMSTARTPWQLTQKYLCFIGCVDHAVQRNIVGTDKNEIFINDPRISLFLVAKLCLTLLEPCGLWSAPGDSVAKNLSANAGDEDLILGLGRSLDGRNGNTLQYSCLGNPMDRGAYHAAVHEVTQLSN